MNLFCFGLGYSAETLVRCHGKEFRSISGTVRTEEKARRLRQQGIDAFMHAGGASGAQVRTALVSANRLLVSAAPDEAGDPMLRHLGEVLREAKALEGIIYLSTVGVYGDHAGAWIDETAPLKPISERAKRRVAAEQAWLDFGQSAGIPVQLHRLAGIYGPGRNVLEDLRDGTARRIIKPGQVFNRIHVEDIAGAALAGMRKPNVSGAFNICDDEPSPPQDVVLYAAGLLGVAPPPERPFAEAGLSTMGLSFYSECKRCRNARLKAELGYVLRHRTYREGLASIVAAF